MLDIHRPKEAECAIEHCFLAKSRLATSKPWPHGLQLLSHSTLRSKVAQVALRCQASHSVKVSSCFVCIAVPRTQLAAICTTFSFLLGIRYGIPDTTCIERTAATLSNLQFCSLCSLDLLVTGVDAAKSNTALGKPIRSLLVNQASRHTPCCLLKNKKHLVPEYSQKNNCWSGLGALHVAGSANGTPNGRH